MAKIVVLELGFEDDDTAEQFAEALNNHLPFDESMVEAFTGADVIECRVENP